MGLAGFRSLCNCSARGGVYHSSVVAGRSIAPNVEKIVIASLASQHRVEISRTRWSSAFG
jgi:hypothetical protein